MSHAFKKVTPKEPLKLGNRSAVEMVTKWGDEWALMGRSVNREWAHSCNVMTDRPHDQTDAALMRMMERGERARVKE